MKKTIWLLLLSSTFLFTQCTKDEDTTLPEPTVELDCATEPAPCELAEENNAFGFSVFQKLHEAAPDENIFISPLSISTALSMTVNGADGETKEAMQQTLQLNDWNLPDVNAAYDLLLNGLPTLDEEVKLQLANSIWYKENYPIVEDFLTTNEENYGSEVNEIDFASPDALDRINGWVEDNTNGKIKKIINKIPSNVVMFLLNAIYFKGNWTHPFDEEMTREASFFPTPETEEPVDMMVHPMIELPFMQTETFTAVDLPYGDSIYSMSVIVPKENYTVSDVIPQLTTENWNVWVNQFEPAEIQVGLPKFELEYEEKLNDILTDMGMGVAFTDAADFSRLTPGGGVKISEVRHKSFIEVDEKGAEAAAVTVVVIVETSVPPGVYANKPFLFVIRENATNSVLFIGKMMNPNA